MSNVGTTYRTGQVGLNAPSATGRGETYDVEQQQQPSHRTSLPRGVILLPPGEGRHYPCGPMESVFLADGEETHRRYSVSIWWVAPNKPGPGAHSHAANEELFYVIEGTMTFRVGEEWVDAPAGTFLRVPGGVTHDFENRTGRRAAVLNVFIPGGFESRMPEIVEWFHSYRRDETEGSSNP